LTHCDEAVGRSQPQAVLGVLEAKADQVLNCWGVSSLEESGNFQNADSTYGIRGTRQKKAGTEEPKPTVLYRVGQSFHSNPQRPQRLNGSPWRSAL
jgi:hypothetical protein